MRALLLALGVLAGSFATAAQSPGPQPLDPEAVTVIDGDTIRVEGEARTWRLTGFNAPETHDGDCLREQRLGFRAASRLAELIETGPATLERVACACAPGAEGTARCNYGRLCGVLRIGGRPVSEILIAEGLAVSFVCTGRSCPPTPKPWCAADVQK